MEAPWGKKNCFLGPFAPKLIVMALLRLQRFSDVFRSKINSNYTVCLLCVRVYFQAGPLNTIQKAKMHTTHFLISMYALYACCVCVYKQDHALTLYKGPRCTPHTLISVLCKNLKWISNQQPVSLCTHSCTLKADEWKLVMACHIPPVERAKKQREFKLATIAHPRSLNSSFFLNEMGLLTSSGIS